MRRRYSTVAAVAAVSLLIASTTTVAAKPGDDSLTAHYSYAGLEAGAGGLWECGAGEEAAGAVVSFRYVEGDHLQAPLGSGKPTTWSDLEPFLQIYGCDDSYFEFWAGAYDLSGQFDSTQLMIETYKNALLDIEVPLYLGDDWTGVTATFEVTWVAAGPPVVLHEGTGLTREAQATVSGSVTFLGLDQIQTDLGATLGNADWDGTVTFDLGDASGSLGQRVGITHP